VACDAFHDYLHENQPVVFVGPYEHHSNEVTWREGMATVVEVRLSEEGCVCMDHLTELLNDPRYLNRPRIGSFSAASNVTGMCTPVHEVARLLHQHDACACFDFAASGPYVKIDMNPPGDPDASLDAVFVSPHKFLGGPGSSGILVFNERMYRRDLAPTVGGGGTVDYVGYDGHDFTDDIEEREKAGTPGVLQTLKAALAFEVKRVATEEAIHAREVELTARAFERWQAHPGIEILGNPDPAKRVGIVSFNLKAPDGSYLHPKFVTTLANDLFGIQSRAGCSCAGPYGHRLLDIDRPTSDRYRLWIQKGFHGIKPGWCRVGFHYVMDDAEADYVIAAVEFIASKGSAFLSEYAFEVETGAWDHRRATGEPEAFSLAAALESTAPGRTALTADERGPLYREYLDAAEASAARLMAGTNGGDMRLEGEVGDLQYFQLPKACSKQRP
jgi:selenocysteine lyase/cysteine desulfurase